MARLNEDSMTELRVRVRDTTSGKILKGENAPLASELEAWLEKNPGYEEVPQDVDSDDSDDETKGEGDEADPDTIKAKLETAMKGKFIVCDVRACVRHFFRCAMCDHTSARFSTLFVTFLRLFKAASLFIHIFLTLSCHQKLFKKKSKSKSKSKSFFF